MTYKINDKRFYKTMNNVPNLMGSSNWKEWNKQLKSALNACDRKLFACLQGQYLPEITTPKDKSDKFILSDLAARFQVQPAQITRQQVESNRRSIMIENEYLETWRDIQVLLYAYIVSVVERSIIAHLHDYEYGADAYNYLKRRYEQSSSK